MKMTKNRRREELALLVGLEVLLLGIAFDSHDLRRLPFRQSQITRVVKALMDAGVLTRIGTRQKYLFTREFLNTLKEQVLQRTPRSGIIQFPVMTTFDACGVEHWSEQEFDRFVRTLKEHWQSLRRK
ncbi:MAG: hypothetical protein JRM82_03420 [Nitrososphaerota archaeon]|nr:hypothetical protein [Nitrososphaerota archaeon]